MPITTKSSNHKYKALLKTLVSEQRELGKRMQRRFGGVSIQLEPDDEAAQAIGSITRDMEAATMERERETLTEIEAAISRIRKGEYGICESCQRAISDARLRALPWARLCIFCASLTASSPEEYLRVRRAS